MGYRVYVGSTEDDYEPEDGMGLIDRIVETWQEAQRILLADLDTYANDRCDDCRTQGMSAAESLRTATPGTRWSDEVDGEFYFIGEV